MTPINELIKIGFDASPAEKGAKQFEAAAEKVATSGEKARDSMGRFQAKAKGTGDAMAAATAPADKLSGAASRVGRAMGEISSQGGAAQVIDKLTKSTDSAAKSGDGARDAFGRFVKGAKDAGAAGGQAAGGVDQLGDEIKETGEQADGAAPRLDKFGGSMGAALTIAQRFLAGAAITAAIGFVLKAAGEYDDVMADIRGSTSLAREEVDGLGDALKSLSTRTTSSVPELAKVALAGWAGGGRTPEELKEFVDAVTRAGVTAGIGSEQDGIDLGRLVRVTGGSIGDVRELTEAIDALGDSLGVSGKEVKDTALDLAASAPDLGVTAKQYAAIAAAFSGMGTEGGSAGQVVNRIFETMRKGARDGGDVAEVLERITGIAKGELSQALRDDAVGALQKFIAGMSGVQRSGGDVRAVLEKLDLADQRLLKNILPIIGGSERLSQALEIAGDSAGNAASSSEEFEDKMGQLLPRLSQFWNTVKAAAEETGGPFTHALAGAVGGATELVRALFDLNEEGEEIAPWAETAEKALLALGVGAMAGGAVYALQYAGSLGVIVKWFGTATTAVRAFTVALATNPFGLAAIAIGAAVAALVYFKDETFEIGDKTVSMAALVESAWEVLSERVVESWHVVIDMLEEFWPWVEKAAAEGWEFVSDSAAELINWLTTGWGDLWEDWKTYAKDGANFVIATLKSIGDTVGIIVGKQLEFFDAFGRLDFSSVEGFKRSIASAGAAMRDALDPSKAWEDIKGTWESNFERDFVGEAYEVGEGYAQDLVDGISFVLEEVGQSDLYQWFEAGTGLVADEIDRTVDEILSRAEAKVRRSKEKVARPGAAAGVYFPADDLSSNPTPTDFGDLLITDKMRDARRRLAEMNAELETEADLVRRFAGDQTRLNDERERAKAIVEAQKVAEEAYGTATQEAADAVDQYMESLVRLQQTRRYADGVETVQKLNREISEQTRLLGESAVVRENAAKIVEYQAAAEKVYAGDIEASSAATSNFIERIEELEQAERLRGVFDDVGHAAADAFVSGATEADNFRGALLDLYDTARKVALQAFITKPLGDFLGGALASGLGGTYETVGADGVLSTNASYTGELTPIAGARALGGNVYPGGRFLVGEHGPEVVDFDAPGRVSPFQQAGSGPTINMTVYAQDAQSFRKSSRQVAQALRGQLGGR